MPENPVANIKLSPPQRKLLVEVLEANDEYDCKLYIADYFKPGIALIEQGLIRAVTHNRHVITELGRLYLSQK